MVRTTASYSFAKFRHRIYIKCMQLPAEELNRVCGMIDDWEPEVYWETEEGCIFVDLMNLQRSTIYRIAILLDRMRLQAEGLVPDPSEADATLRRRMRFRRRLAMARPPVSALPRLQLPRARLGPLSMLQLPGRALSPLPASPPHSSPAPTQSISGLHPLPVSPPGPLLVSSSGPSPSPPPSHPPQESERAPEPFPAASPPPSTPPVLPPSLPLSTRQESRGSRKQRLGIYMCVSQPPPALPPNPQQPRPFVGVVLRKIQEEKHEGAPKDKKTKKKSKKRKASDDEGESSKENKKHKK